MSNNYYWDPKGTKFGNAVPFKLEPLHLSHTAGGWEMSFQAYKVDITEVTVELSENIRATLPINLKLHLTSWQEWKTFLAEQGGTIRDEYGTEVTLEELVHLAEVVLCPGALWREDKPLLNHHDHVVNDQRYPETRERYLKGDVHWKDPQGYSFSLQEFS